MAPLEYQEVLSFYIESTVGQWLIDLNGKNTIHNPRCFITIIIFKCNLR